MIIKQLMVTGAILMAGIAVVPAQTTRPRRPAAPPPPDPLLRPLVERYLTAWSTRNPDRAASLYAPDPGLIFYDLIGTPHTGWEDYKQSRVAFFDQFSSVQLNPNPDIQVSSRGTVAWTAVSFKGTAVDKNREVVRLEGRHTAVWERRGTDWLIVQEHLSVPLADVAALVERFRPPPPPEDDGREAVTAIFDKYEQAWNKGDSQALGGLWRETGDIVTLGAGGITRGRPAVSTMWSDVISRRTATFSTALDVAMTDFRSIAQDVALVDGTFDYRRAGADRTGPPAAQERFSSVLTRVDHEWGIASLRVAVVEQRPPTSTKPKK